MYCHVLLPPSFGATLLSSTTGLAIQQGGVQSINWTRCSSHCAIVDLQQNASVRIHHQKIAVTTNTNKQAIKRTNERTKYGTTHLHKPLHIKIPTAIRQNYSLLRHDSCNIGSRSHIKRRVPARNIIGSLRCADQFIC